MNAKFKLPVVVLFVVLIAVPMVGAASPGPPPTADRTGVAQLQEANETTSVSPGEQIDSELALVSSSYDPNAGTVTLTLQADSARAVTLADAGGFIDGGTINRRTLVVQEGQTSVEFAVTETQRGYVGVSIATDETLYAEVVRSPSLSPFRGSSGTVGWFGGAAIVLLSFVGAAFWKLYKEGGEPVEATA